MSHPFLYSPVGRSLRWQSYSRVFEDLSSYFVCGTMWKFILQLFCQPPRRSCITKPLVRQQKWTQVQRCVLIPPKYGYFQNLFKTQKHLTTLVNSLSNGKKIGIKCLANVSAKNRSLPRTCYIHSAKETVAGGEGAETNPWNFYARSCKDILQQQQTGRHNYNDSFPCSLALGICSAQSWNRAAQARAGAVIL